MESQHPAKPRPPSSASLTDLLLPTAHSNEERVTSPSDSATLSPVYWPTETSNGPGRQRAESGSSSQGPQIRLLDHTDEDSEQFRACWARSAHVPNWVIVGATSGLRSIGSYVVFNCVIETVNVSRRKRAYKHVILMASDLLQSSNITLLKRYSQFDTLRAHLVQTFPNSTAALPKLPPKSALSKSTSHSKETWSLISQLDSMKSFSRNEERSWNIFSSMLPQRSSSRPCD